jgi:hypothetical protein
MKVTREVINTSDFLEIIAVKDGDRIKRYEITSVDENGFYRISEDRIEKSKVYFPGKWNLEDILKDITKVVSE